MKQPVKLSKQKDEEIILPSQLYLETTNRCNSKCNICVRTFEDLEPSKDLSIEEALKIIEQFPHLERVVLHGIGEPLLNKDLLAIIKLLKDKGVYVLFNSNASLLTDVLSKELIRSGLDEIRISLDAATQVTYQKIRGVPFFDSVIQNVKDLVNLKKSLESDQPNISIWFTGSRTNIHELPDLIRLADHIGVKDVNFQRLTYLENPKNGSIAIEDQSIYEKPDKDVLEIIEESHYLAKRLGINFTSSGATTPLKSLRKQKNNQTSWQKCMRPWGLSYITANGNILPCCISPFATGEYKDLVLGNIFQRPFKEIWNNKRYKGLRKDIKSSNPPSYCNGCGKKWSL